MSSNLVIYDYSLITDYDVFLFKQGKHFQLYNILGSRLVTFNGIQGVYFAVWAPSAEKVFVMGDFNHWNRRSHLLNARLDGSGIWEGFIPGITKGEIYKYCIVSGSNGSELERGDPFALHWEIPPKTASIVWDLQFEWQEGNWKDKRKGKNTLSSPISVYEMHFGSWKKTQIKKNCPLTYLEMAEILPTYLKEMGFTHVEFLPIMEHPFYGSWGYQKIGYFSPTSRYGKPQDFMYLIQQLHQNQIGVYLDWVPSHFPRDEHGLGFFDGSYLFEHQDPRMRIHPEWKSNIFNYNRNEIRSFLISSATFWLDMYHVDGLRVDGVSSMLYLNYARKQGEWTPNVHGGHENLEAIVFLRDLNAYIYKQFPHAQIIAEEATAWPMVSHPIKAGGLGFGMKWNMGWMHDTLQYFNKDPIYRKHHHKELLFSMQYFYNENFLLALSHDEVVYGKKSLLNKMPGDTWQKFANLRLLYSYLFTHPGKKLLFMGAEIGQWNEWDHERSLDWHLLQHPLHLGVQTLIRDLNHLYQTERALYELDFSKGGFKWLEFEDAENSVIAYVRKEKSEKEMIVVACNFTSSIQQSYCIQMPIQGRWKEIFNSDSQIYGGSGIRNLEEKETLLRDVNTKSLYFLNVTLPPLAVVMFKNIEV